MARYLAGDGNGDRVAELLARHAEATLAEPGCLEFVPLRGTSNPLEFVLYERYADRAAFDAHRASPHFEGIARDQIRPLLADRSADIFEPVRPGSAITGGSPG